MASATFELPSDLLYRLEPHSDELSEILELGLREMQAKRQPGYSGMAEIVELLATLPSPEQILALQPSDALHERVLALIEKNREEGLTASEEQEWQQFEYLEDLVRIAKASALLKLKS